MRKLLIYKYEIGDAKKKDDFIEMFEKEGE